MSRFRPSGLLDWTFEIGMVIKAIDGVLEIVGGVLLLLVSKATLDSWVVGLTQHELSEDPRDFFATHLLSAAHNMSGSGQLFAAVYLVVHGVVKLVLVAAVLRDKLWAYPWMIGFLVAFIVYQSYRLVVDATVGIAVLTVFDVFLVWLTYREYGKRSALLASRGAAAA